MRRWYFSLLMLLIVGCGGSSTSNTTSKGVQELDGGGGATAIYHSAGEIDLEKMKESPLFHEFDVDFFSEEPIQRAESFTVSSADTYKISLKTLGYLMEAKRFPLVQADTLTQKGLPKVIAPIGYSVNLEVVGNQIVAVIKSTTSPEKSVRPAIITISGNHDIIVGDPGSLQLLFSGLQKDLSQPNISNASLTTAITGLNRYVSYNHKQQWFMQFAKHQRGLTPNLSAQIGKQWDVSTLGNLQLSVQNVYCMRDGKQINAASFKYSTSQNGSGWQGQIMMSMTLNQNPIAAFGGGGQIPMINKSKLTLGVVVSRWDVNTFVDYVLDF